MSRSFPGKRSLILAIGGCVAILVSASHSHSASGLQPGAATGPVPSAEAVGDVFRDCDDVCPEMVVVPAGRFLMGSSENSGLASQRPQHEVVISHPFALGRYEVTFDEWDACVTARVCPQASSAFEGPGHDEGWGRGRLPVINISWREAELYVGWLSTKTGQSYRLPSEAEWEYAARAGTRSDFNTGRNTLRVEEANFRGARTVLVGSYPPNGWGLHDMHANVAEWLQDCWNEDYVGAPADGSARMTGECHWRSQRGGSWGGSLAGVRVMERRSSEVGARSNGFGLRVARSLSSERVAPEASRASEP